MGTCLVALCGEPLKEVSDHKPCIPMMWSGLDLRVGQLWRGEIGVATLDSEYMGYFFKHYRVLF